MQEGAVKDMYGEGATQAHAMAEGERKYKEMRAMSPMIGRNHAGVRACEQKSVAFVLVVLCCWLL